MPCAEKTQKEAQIPGRSHLNNGGAEDNDTSSKQSVIFEQTLTAEFTNSNTDFVFALFSELYPLSAELISVFQKNWYDFVI